MFSTSLLCLGLQALDHLGGKADVLGIDTRDDDGVTAFLGAVADIYAKGVLDLADEGIGHAENACCDLTLSDSDNFAIHKNPLRLFTVYRSR